MIKWQLYILRFDFVNDCFLVSYFLTCEFSNLIRSMGVAKVTQKFFKANFAIWLIFHRINFVSSVLEFFSAVSAYKTFRMEFVAHGRHTPANDQFATDITIVSGQVGFVNGHFFQKCSAEHFRHIFLLKGFLQDA